MNDPFADLGIAIARRRWLVVGLWVVLLLPCAALWPRADTTVKTSGFQLPQTQAAKASVILQREFSASAGADAVIAYHSADLTVADAAYRSEVGAATRRILSVPGVRSVRTFYNAADPSLVSRDHHTAIALVSTESSATPTIITTIRDRLHSISIEHYVTGNLAVQQDVFATSQDDLRRFELIAFPVMLILLLLVFRTVVAASMPLLLGTCSVTVATALIALIASAIDVSIFALNVASMIGLGLGIDFSLILITRFRQEMANGWEPTEAVARTMATAGRSVTFSAITVMLAMLVMTLFMHDFMILRSISMGVTIVALTSLLAALTLLPAVLSILGSRVEWLRVVPSRRRGRDLQHVDSGTAARWIAAPWYRLSHAIMRHPWRSLVASLLLLATLAIPVRDIATGVKTFGDLPATAESVRGARLMSNAFGPGRLTPIQIVLQAGHNGIWRPGFLSALKQLSDTAAADPRTQSVESLSTVAQAAGIDSSKFTSLTQASLSAHPGVVRAADQLVNLHGGNNVALITIIPKYEEFAAPHQRLVHDLRDRIIPAMPQLGPYTVLVGGEAANSIDFVETVYGRFPLIVGMVLLITFIVLLMFFQSITLPFKAILMNLATMLATYGVLVAVFQYGWGSGLLGFSPENMLDLVTPVILYAILFALSTDYEVFMLSRVKEYYHEMRNNTEAVAAGLQNVGGMITAAGLILIATFGAFASAHVLTLKELGVGLAVGVLLDSTVVRIVMVPASMRLMSDWNWWMPSWLKGIVPELREAPVLQPVPAAAPGMVSPGAGMPGVAVDGALPISTVKLAGLKEVDTRKAPVAGVRAAGRRVVGQLRPMGESVGADVIELPQTNPLRIGRDRSNELQLFDPFISRYHARIAYAGGQYLVSDLGSQNGTFVNLQQIPPHRHTPLQPGDVIRIGKSNKVTFAFQLSTLEYPAPAEKEEIGDAR